MLLPLLLCVGGAAVALGYPTYQMDIPNGKTVPNPCNTQYTWQGVGHNSFFGSGTRNQFGNDFAAEGHMWTKKLCMMDSDQDGKSNGVELGDPSCSWVKAVADVSMLGNATSHPGICEPVMDAKCMALQSIRC